MCLTRDSITRTKLVLESVPLATSIKILKQNNECSSLIGGVLYEMFNSVLEDRGYDYTKRELGQPIKKFPVPKLLNTLFEYFKECSKVAKDAAMNSLLNAVVKVTDSRVINEEVLNKELINFMITLVMNGKVSYDHAQQISIVVSKMWARTRADDKRSLQFVRQTSTVINPRILSGEEEHQMLALRALNILLQVMVLQIRIIVLLVMVLLVMVLLVMVLLVMVLLVMVLLVMVLLVMVLQVMVLLVMVLLVMVLLVMVLLVMVLLVMVLLVISYW